MRVIGTAGHVDHGKSTLVQYLTGIDPDRLIEEKKREMTIDLGFAWLTLGEETVGIVDVPGHRDFIENMLAGIGGIDAVLLVIAADEGVMPQTREHLAILDLLGIEHGIVVLTKVDLVTEDDWLELVEQEIQDVLRGTILEGVEILRVSAVTGEGIPELKQHVTRLLTRIPAHVNYHHPRLPIDRIFTVSGFGTVVTGTLSGGIFNVGDEIEVQPIGLQGRIRGLQSYKQSVETALPGSRVAVNIAGIDKGEIARGDVLTYQGQLQPTKLVDVRFHHLHDAGRNLKHNAEIKFFSGSSETVARARLLDARTLAPGEEGWVQFSLSQPIALAQGDRFIVRYPSPPQTIGGGIVINAHANKRWKRFRPEVIAELQTRMEGSPAERVTQAASEREPQNWQKLQKATAFDDSELRQAIEDAIEQNLLTELAENSYLATASVQEINHAIITELKAYHQANSLRRGMSREELRSRAGLKLSLMNSLLEQTGEIVADGTFIRLPDHQVQFSSEQQHKIDELMRLMGQKPYSPPTFTEATQIVGQDVIYALIDLGEIIQVQSEIIFRQDAYREMVSQILKLIDEEGDVEARRIRDAFETSRKYVIALLEHLDAIQVTKRVGDKRIRGRANL